MFVFVCWTPYQVFNAINFVLSDVEGSKNNADIYIYHDFSSSEKLSSALKKANVFCNVYDIEVYDKKRRVWYSKFNKIKRLLMPYSTIKKYLKADIDVRKKGYKTLIISGNNLFSINMYNAIKNLEVYFIDDGLGTYTGDLRDRDITLLYKIFNKLFNRGPLSYDVKKVYVNNKGICKSTISENICQLPRLRGNEQFTDMAKQIFEYKQSSYSDKKYVYITQPLYETVLGKKAEEIEKEILNSIKDKVIVRVHPRQSMDEYTGYECDTNRNLWELECVEQITDEHVLMGGFSTALFIPKFLYNSEPTVIFTYKLFGLEIESLNETIELFKSTYKDKSKIIIAENLAELQQLIKDIQEKKE